MALNFWPIRLRVNLLFTVFRAPIQPLVPVAVNAQHFGSDTDMSFLAASSAVFGVT